MGEVMRYAYIIDGTIFGSEDEADEAYPSILAEKVELREGQCVVGGQIVELVDSLTVEYKVTWNTQTIPFWENFEGAKACTLAINSNKNGSRARLVSFVREKEIEV